MFTAAHIMDEAANLADLVPNPWAVAGTGIAAYATYRLLKRYIFWTYLSPLRILPGPEPSSNYILGHIKAIFESSWGLKFDEWIDTYGRSFTYTGFVWQRGLITSDSRAVTHMINHAYAFPKPWAVREDFIELFGTGILSAEGDVHKRQRKIMNPCFGPAQIRDLMPIFYEKALKLREVWATSSEGEGGVIDILPWLTRTTLDVIGAAGFGYEFNSLTEGEGDELAQAFKAILDPPRSNPLTLVWAVMQQKIPVLRILPGEISASKKKSKETTDRIGRKLIADKRKLVLEEKGTSAARDILSVLLRANMEDNLKDSERLSEDEVVGQIATMLLAGHETTSSTLTWLLYDLAKPEYHPVQEMLRTEVMALQTDQPSMEELNSLKYLDCVTREALRKNPVVTATIRSAEEDSMLPVSQPIVGRDGITRNEIRVQKDTIILIPIITINRDKAIWGADANQFRPESLMTFLGGPRACIGYRLAVMELKVILFTLMRNFTFELSDPSLVIETTSGMIARPAVKSEDGKTEIKLPLLVKNVQ
ncbi:hypothetical protein FRB90_002571 [Tulasnella sp. 427]|nr:hypothetical protein FRB90_002571 [Tulasnella sp. 427]